MSSGRGSQHSQPPGPADSAADRRSAAAAPEFGQSLRALRVARGLNQKQLAERAQVDPSTVSRLESGGRGVSREAVGRLAEALGATPAQHHELLIGAGFLTEEVAALLEQPEIAQLSLLLSNGAVSPADRRLLLTYVRLALDHAAALGYRVPTPWEPDAEPPS